MSKTLITLILLLSFFTNAKAENCVAEAFYDLNADSVVFLIGPDKTTPNFIDISQHPYMVPDCVESFINMIAHGDSVTTIAGLEVPIKYVLNPEKVDQLQIEDLVNVLNSLRNNADTINYEFRLSSEQEGKANISFTKKSL